MGRHATDGAHTTPTGEATPHHRWPRCLDTRPFEAAGRLTIRAHGPAEKQNQGGAAVIGASELGARPDLPPRWPQALRADLARRRDVLVELAAVSGAANILELARPDHRHLVTEVMTHGPDPATPRDFDAVVSVAGLSRIADLSAAVAAVSELVTPDAVWLACEPGYRPGLLAMAAASAGVLLPPARGVHLARDLPATLRHHGLVVTDIERFTMPTLLWPLRPFVQLRAIRPSALVDGGVS